jgi:hypothetical protein
MSNKSDSTGSLANVPPTARAAGEMGGVSHIGSAIWRRKRKLS